jgi:ATP-dependent Clp protease protease subunit
MEYRLLNKTLAKMTKAEQDLAKLDMAKGEVEIAKLNMTFDRGLDIDSRILYIFDDIDESMAENIIMGLSHLSKTDEPITIMVNSQGGSVSDMFAIYDAMQACDNEITTIGIGEVCSAAGLLLVGGDKRLAAPHTMFMAHNVSGGYNADEELYTAKSQIDATLKCWKMWAKCMAEHTNRNEKYWLKDMGNTKREMWLDTDDMLKKVNGIIDGVWGA